MKRNYLIAKLAFCCFCFITYTVTAQNKRMLLPKDYSLWSDLVKTNLSENGKWVSYVLDYKAADTLVLQEIDTGVKMSFGKARNSQFSLDSKWFAYVQNDSLKILDLEREKIRFVSKRILDFNITDESDYVVSSNLNNGKKKVSLLNLKQLRSTTIEHVDEYKISPEGNCIAVATSEKGSAAVKIVYLIEQLKEKVIATDSKSLFYGLQWDDSGKKVAFYQKIVDSTLSYVNHKIYNCTVSKSKLVINILDPITNSSFPKGFYVPKTKLFVSDKQHQVFFDIKLLPNDLSRVDKKSNVEVWLSESRSVPPVNEVLQKYNTNILSVWWPAEDRVLMVEDSISKNAVLTGDHLNALLLNESDFFPQQNYVGNYTNYYIKDLYTGKKELLLPFHSTLGNMVMVSPAGKYISYFKDRQWWVYDIKKKNHSCLTKGLPTSFHNFKYDFPGQQPSFGPSAWTLDDKELLVYDLHDIWKLSTNGKFKTRLTDGATNGITYRIEGKKLKASVLANRLGHVSNAFSVDNDLLLKTFNTSTYAEGFALLSNGVSPRFLIEKDSKLHLVKKLKASSDYFIIESNYEKAPQLVHVATSKKEKVIVTSNVQQNDFFWGNSKLIDYETKDGKKLKGALFYPADYDAKKQYPMVVHIYEKLSKELNTYVPPSDGSNTGFTITNYTTDGYFVFYPDTIYDLDFTGDSALECVEAGVRKALQMASIDPKLVALMGHSFGGYETSYILGKSSLFKTGIIGAPVVDLVSAYLTLDGHGKSNMFRFEYSQFRISKPFYSDTFINNSPISTMKNIKAPVLIWTGDQDKQVDWKHSMKLHIGLWKLQKKSTFLIYKNEDHILVNENNRVDLSKKIHDWLDYYLKNKHLADWMVQ